ncbi:translocation and assembly module lipoprotein TamL [Nonlabens ponticola]|uniref:Outer membrane protein assembly factor n=1 Tax=Nonlabens ponticola TaxID=2496866 RepID=A0A3S9MUF2_9FLAO|nr:BamA/TamA family outer membrane protein [Nonlabens ponticola]AZQ42798.1 outer membrane protein assembly factor [Nonlabens ponticola]
MIHRRLLAKIGLIVTLVSICIGCSTIKRVPNGQKLLIENVIKVDSMKPNDDRVATLPVQKANSKLLGYPLRLHIYNLARPHRDSIYLKWMQNNPKALKRRNAILSEKQTMQLGEGLVAFNQWLKRTGEAPTLVDAELAERSAERLRQYYWNQGWFNTEVDHKIVDAKRKKRARVKYFVERHQPYIVDSLTREIASPSLDSVYMANKRMTLLEEGVQYRTADINAERNRLYRLFRNNGAFFMEKENIKFEGDTVGTDQKANIRLLIGDQEIKVADSIVSKPFKLHTISKVNIIPDYETNFEDVVPDTTVYKNYNIIRYQPKKYKNRPLADAIFFEPGNLYRDIDRDRTYKRITELNSFLYPAITYEIDPDDPTGEDLIANVLLTSKKKYNLVFGTEGSHSNIQTFGIGLNTSLLIRNIFRGSELLDISFRGNIGASSNNATGDSRFFDLQEIGADARLIFPRFFFPLETDGVIPKFMSPSTELSLGFFKQTNIGLDRQSVNGALSYRWQQTPIKSTRFDLINAQYVRNLDPQDFFNVYRSSYSSLNDIANDLDLMDARYVNEENDLTVPLGTNNFINDAISGNLDVDNNQQETIRNIRERRDRLVQNNLIIASSYNWIRNNRQGIYDEDFSRISLRLESAGNLIAGVSSLIGIDENADGQRRVFGVEFSQYLKPEVEYIKHWQYTNGHVFAIKAFGGVAIPYGNSDNIPFIRSFFAGGPNDNRAWQAYELGPGSTGGLNDFNVANMKLAFNAEYRFPLAGAFKGAVFTDIGNIWNVLDSEEDPDAVFNEFTDLQYIAIGTGLGIRYDFGFFVLRFDVGFKTYNPALEPGNRWFREVNFSDSVFNVGINYPF